MRTPAVASVALQDQATKLSVPLTVQDKISYWSVVYGVKKELALCIAQKESNFKPMAKNKSSSAVGTYQILRDTWTETVARMDLSYTLEERYNEDKNIQVATWLMGQNEYWRWVTYPKCL